MKTEIPKRGAPPWHRFENSEGWSILDADNRHVAYCDHNIEKYPETAVTPAALNSQLIAAAPELLGALQSVFKLLPDYPAHEPNAIVVSDARKAMHKSEGNA